MSTDINNLRFSFKFPFFFPNFSIVIQAYVDAVLDLASHFITRLRRYASFCRTLASHAVTAGTGSNRNMVASPTQSTGSPATNQGQYALTFLGKAKKINSIVGFNCKMIKKEL